MPGTRPTVARVPHRPRHPSSHSSHIRNKNTKLIEKLRFIFAGWWAVAMTPIRMWQVLVCVRIRCITLMNTGIHRPVPSPNLIRSSISSPPPRPPPPLSLRLTRRAFFDFVHVAPTDTCRLHALNTPLTPGANRHLLRRQKPARARTHARTRRASTASRPSFERRASRSWSSRPPWTPSASP